MKRERNGLKRKNLNKDVKNLKPQKNQHKKLTLILKSCLSYFQKQVYTIVFFLEGLKNKRFFRFLLKDIKTKQKNVLCFLSAY